MIFFITVTNTMIFLCLEFEWLHDEIFVLQRF